ncbi:hypothetical protein D3C85_1737680 [compost metagenome]
MDLGHHALELTAGAVAPEQRQGVENVTENPGAGQHVDSAAVRLYALGAQVALHVAADAGMRIPEMVTGLEHGQRPEQER